VGRRYIRILGKIVDSSCKTGIPEAIGLGKDSRPLPNWLTIYIEFASAWHAWLGNESSEAGFTASRW
jgi:hypothetical protein